MRTIECFTEGKVPVGNEEVGYLHLERNEIDYTRGLINEGYEKPKTGLFRAEQAAPRRLY